MTRISLKEAYDNRDVVAQLVADRQDIDEIKQILAELPDPDLTNVVLKTGDQTIAGEKTFTDVIHADGGLDLANMGPLTVNGDLEVNGDIIQNGSAYETHAEQVFSVNDYIVTRDGAVGSLPAGGYSGIQVKKYNGVDDCRLVVDNTGTARVGDINDEQPLMTRDESVDMSNGALLKWDGVHGKAVSSPMDNTPTADSVNAVTSDGIKTAIDGAVSTLNSAISGKVAGTGNIGDDKKPVKIVNGQAVQVSAELMDQIETAISVTAGTGITLYQAYAKKIGRMVEVHAYFNNPSGGFYGTLVSLSSTAVIRPAMQIITSVCNSTGYSSVWSSDTIYESSEDLAVPADSPLEGGTYVLSLVYLTKS